MAITIQERFWSKVNKTDDCWVWTGPTAGSGKYGQFHVSGGSTIRARMYAHRWAYESLVGPVPDGLELDHLCRNRLCVNPTHLEPVTHAENQKRRRGYKTGPYDVGPACRRGHLRTPENTGVNNQGARFCRPCARDASAQWRMKKQTAK